MKVNQVDNQFACQQKDTQFYASNNEAGQNTTEVLDGEHREIDDQWIYL